MAQENRPTSLIARELHGFCNYLKLDMEHEESTILGEGLLQS